MPAPRIALLACSVFEREIVLLTRDARHIAEARWFGTCLHKHRVRQRVEVIELNFTDDFEDRCVELLLFP